MPQYAYERPFRLKILALLLNNRWFAEYGKLLIQPEYFERDDEEAIAKAIIDYQKVYGKCPTDPDDVIALASPKFAELIYDVFDIYEQNDLDLARDRSIDFAKEQAIKLALLESVDNVTAGTYGEIVARIQDAIKVGDNLLSSGIDPIRDTDKWLYDYWSDRVKTGMYHIDNILDGGLGMGELGVVIGPPNQGKSMALVNIGYGAASIGSGKNVVHFTHEMKIEQVAKRYAARVAFRFPTRDTDLKVYEDNLIEVARRFLPGQIRILGGHRMGFDEVRANLSRLRDTGFNFDLIIDDYPALMVPPRKYNERRFELSGIFEEWRAIATEYKVPVWGATQSTRGSLSKEIITMADVAEDIGIAAVSDVMIAICQTYEEKQSDRARWYVAKLRDGSNKHPLIGCKWYSDAQAIVTTGFVEPKQKERDA